MNEPANPYQAPLEHSAEINPKAQRADENSFGQIAKRTFLAWEKLRLAYIAFCGMATFGAMLMFQVPMDKFEIWGLIVFGGIAANFCYLAGPAVETYISWLGFNGKLFRVPAFLAGMIFTCVCVVISVYDLSRI